MRGEQFLYTFPSTDAYLAAKSGQNPLGYTTLQQLFGNRAADYNSAFYGLFAQDDWQMTPQLKVLYGIRYDLFDVPSARPFAANPYSQDFTIDKNNFGPRAGLSWAVDSSARTVVRASTGLMYEPPLLDFYDNAILNNGDPASFTVSVAGHQRGRAAVPGQPGERAVHVRAAAAEHHRGRSGLQDPVGVAEQRPDRARADQRPRRVGGLRQLDRPQPAGADRREPDPDAARRCRTAGRSTRPPSARATRVDPTFNQVNMFKSIGESTYNAFTATMTKRMTHGWMAQATYTLARGEDTAPLTGTYVVGSGTIGCRIRRTWIATGRDAVQPDAHLLAVDGHRAAGVGRPRRARRSGTTTRSASSCRRTAGCRSTSARSTDLNGDGVTNDRPNGVERNAGRLGRVFYLDLRYSRFIPIRGRAARGAVLRGEEPVQHGEHRRREPGRPDRRARQPDDRDLVPRRRLSDRGQERLRSALDPARIQVHVLSFRRAGSGHRAPTAPGAACRRTPITPERRGPQSRYRKCCHASLVSARPFARRSRSFIASRPAAQLRVAPVGERPDGVALELMLRKLASTGTFMQTDAHPDDEDNGLLAMLGHGHGMRTALVTLTRGDGGQNEIGPEIGQALGVLRTEELLGGPSLRRRRAVLHARDRLRLLLQRRGVDREVGARRDRRRSRAAHPDDPSRRHRRVPVRRRQAAGCITRRPRS